MEDVSGCGTLVAEVPGEAWRGFTWVYKLSLLTFTKGYEQKQGAAHKDNYLSCSEVKRQVIKVEGCA